MLRVEEVDDVFRALADPTRRLLLDRLFERDGQTLGGLSKGLEMTRFGAMKHLRVLESAGLIATVKVGREKRHYLNPVPIQLLAERWVGKYAAPWASALGSLRDTLEDPAMSTGPSHLYEVFIRTSPDQLWLAITDGSWTARYFYGTAVESSWEPGAQLRYTYPNGTVAADGEVIEADKPRRLVHTFHATWDPDVDADPPHRVTWEIEPMGEVCRLRVLHDDFGSENATYASVTGGLSVIISGLKTLLETGEELRVPEPAAAG
jgi:DNA-binding transcriptional ArsR family regulator/uncharacterized protein YndB with AHSA1/START domain